MATLIELKLQLQARSTALRTSLSGIQQQLSSIQDVKQLVAPVLAEIKAKENDYFVAQRMVEQTPDYSNIKLLQDKAAALSESVQQIEDGLNKLEDELKKEPAQKETLEKIKHELRVLVIPKSKSSSMSPDVDWNRLLFLTAQQLDHPQTRSGFEENELLKEYLSVEQEQEDKNTYRIFLSETGKTLVQDIARDERLEAELGRLGQSMDEQEEKERQLSESVTQFETVFVENVRGRARAAKRSAEEITKNVQTARELLMGLDTLKSQTEIAYLKCFVLDENASLQELEACAEYARRTLTDIESKIGDVNKPLSLLREAELTCNKNQTEFGLARIWGRLLGQIKIPMRKFQELPKNLSGALQVLRTEKEKIDRCIEEKRKLENEYKEHKPVQQIIANEDKAVQQPVISVSNDPVAQARYIQATNECLKRLSDSIKEHVELFKKEAKEIAPNTYLFMATDPTLLNLSYNTGVDHVSAALEKIYQHGSDKQKQGEIEKALMPEGGAQQKSLIYTLQKYKLMTTLKAAAEKSSGQFLEELKKPENKQTLSRQRDNSLMIWARQCGAIVFAIVSGLNTAYGKLFSPKSVDFAKQFEREESVENARSMSRPSAG